MTKKIVLEDLNKPDFFHSLFNRISEFYIMNKRKVISSAGAVILILLIILAWSVYRYYYEKDAWNQYAKIEQSTLTSSISDDLLIKQYRNLSLKYSGSEASILSNYRLGNLYFKKNDIDSAVNSYEKFIEQASDRNDFKVLSYSGLAYCYETKKDYKKALQTLQQAEKVEAGKNFGTFIYRDMGRLYEEMNNRNEALKYYKKALEQSIDPTVTMFIKRKIALVS